MTPRPFLCRPVLPRMSRYSAHPILAVGDVGLLVRRRSRSVARAVVAFLVEAHPLHGTDYLQLAPMPGSPTDDMALRLDAFLAHAGDATAVATGGAT